MRYVGASRPFEDIMVLIINYHSLN